MKAKKTLDLKAFYLISYIITGFFTLITLLPFYVIIMSSFTSEHYILNHGYTFFPREFSLNAYGLVFGNPQKMLGAYAVTVSITVLGTLTSLFISSMASYVMYRKDVKYRNKLAFFLYFTMLFNGGLAPYYIIITRYLHLKNSYLALLLVPMFNVFYILVLRNFMKGSLSDSLINSAKIDGAGDFRIFLQIVLPLSKPALASIGLFAALSYWNDWWTPMMFIDKETLFPLQYVLYRILSSAEMAAHMVNSPIVMDMPKETLKVAMLVVSVGPIILAYPFVQKYFVRGIMIGSVKG